MQVDGLSLEQIAAAGFVEGQLVALRRLVGLTLESDSKVPCEVHPLGFYKFELYSHGAQSVRLHYWPPLPERAVPVATSPYHDHNWSLLSCVLAGKITNVDIKLADDVNGSFILADVVQGAGTDSVSAEGTRVKIASRNVTELGPGSVYSVSAGHFHCTEVGDAETCTLVRSERGLDRSPRTLVPVGMPSHAPARRVLAQGPRAEVVARIARLVAK
jgi:hypothetical protein